MDGSALSGGSPDLNRPVAEVPFMVVDFNGESHGGNGFIAMLPVFKNRAEPGKLRSWHHLDPDSIDPGAAVEIQKALKGRVMVTHALLHDVPRLDSALGKLVRRGGAAHWVDTAALARKLIEPSACGQAARLGEICHQLALPEWERHTTDGDSFATAQLFLILCARLRRKLERPLMLGDLLQR